MVRGAFRVEEVPEEVRVALAARARQQTVERYRLPVSAFEEAERLVVAGQVLVTAGVGQVYDRGCWAMVTLRDCGHCYDRSGGICRHRLAVAFADLLAKYLPGEGQERAPGDGVAGLGRGAGYSGRPLRRSRVRRRSAKRKGQGKGATDHCAACGAFLCADGSCNRCGGGR